MMTTRTRRTTRKNRDWEQSIDAQALEDAGLALRVRGNVLQSLAGRLKNLGRDPPAGASNLFGLHAYLSG